MREAIFVKSLGGVIQVERNLCKLPLYFQDAVSELLDEGPGYLIKSPYDVLKVYCDTVYGPDSGTVDWIGEMCLNLSETDKSIKDCVIEIMKKIKTSETALYEYIREEERWKTL